MHCQFVAQITQHRACVSVRQAAEWGMRTLQSTFPRIKIPLTWDTPERGRLLEIVMYMNNFRARLVGRNQIRTVYSQDWAAVSTAPGARHASANFFAALYGRR